MPRVNSYDPTAKTYVLSPLFADETEKAEQEQLYHLVTLIIPAHPVTGIVPDPLKIVDANHDVLYDDGGSAWGGLEINKGQYTYTKFPLKYQPADINSDGSLSKTSIVIANVSREVMYFVEEYNGLRGARVHIKTVYANALRYTYVFAPDGSVVEVDNSANYNTDACLHDEFYIDTYNSTEQTTTFQLEPIIDLEIRLPRRRYLVDSCYWVYRSPETCGYTGPDPIVNGVPQLGCPKTLAACKLRSNQRYFGGFPGISGSRRIFL